MKLFEGFNAQKIIMILVFTVAIFKVASAIWVGEPNYVNFAGFEAKPVFEILVVGLGILAGYAIVTKFQGGRMSTKDVATLAILAVSFWFVWTKLLGSPTISILASAIAP